MELAITTIEEITNLIERLSEGPHRVSVGTVNLRFSTSDLVTTSIVLEGSKFVVYYELLKRELRLCVGLAKKSRKFCGGGQKNGLFLLCNIMSHCCNNFGLSGRNTENNYINKASFALSLTGVVEETLKKQTCLVRISSHKRLLNLFGDISLHHGITWDSGPGCLFIMNR
jgi:hypothetical protein